jgi:flagellar protein FlbD
MIQLSRLNGGVIAINPDLVIWIEATPDTTIEFLNGDRIMVRESIESVIERVVDFRRAAAPLGSSGAHPPSAAVIAALGEDAAAAVTVPPRAASQRPGSGG